MMFRNIILRLLLLSFLAVPNATGQHNDAIYEEFASMSAHGRPHNYLRRDLQVLPCQAINPLNLVQKDCSGTYPCLCGTTQTSCTYCEIETTRGHVCQVTSSSITFVAPETDTMTTCSCDFVNGASVQACHETWDRAEPEPGTGNPIPIPTTPIVTPQPSPVTSSPGPWTQNPGTVVPPTSTVTCTADNPTTIIDNDCSGTYPCTCIGSTETLCSYCELDTTRGHYCQFTGSTVTFVDKATSLLTTCSCAYANGVATKTCHIPNTVGDSTTTSYQSSTQVDNTLPTAENPVLSSKKSKLRDTWTDLP